ncbi:SRPBCC family protein [Jatrophihabitans fulvus]
MTATTPKALGITAPENTPFLDITREFDAPVSAVFRAHTDRDLVRQWLRPPGRFMDIERFDAVSGGSYRYLHHGHEDDPDDDLRAWFRGTFHTVRADEIIIQTFEYEGVPDAVAIETLRFTPLDGGRCRLDVHSVFPSVEARDSMLESGMEYGLSHAMARLDDLLAGRG